jgi:hypothetical protein
MVTDFFKFIPQDQQILVAGANNRGDLVAGLFERPRDRVGYSGSNTTANYADFAKQLDFRGITKRPKYVVNRATHRNILKMGGAFPNGLNDQADRAGLNIIINNGKRNAFTGFIKS